MKAKKEFTRGQKLQILKDAKEFYIKEVADVFGGMCGAIDLTLTSYFVKSKEHPSDYGSDGCTYAYLKQIFPEFRPSTFGSSEGDEDYYWWSIYDKESRIKAFDKLIEIYSKI